MFFGGETEFQGVQSYWEMNQLENSSENLSYMSQMMTTSFNGISGK